MIMLPSLAVRVLNLPCRKDTEGLNRNTVFSRLGVFPLCLTSKWPAVHFASLYILLYSEKGWRSGAGCLISCDSLAGWLKSPNGFYPSKVLMIREWGKGWGDAPSLLEGDFVEAPVINPRLPWRPGPPPGVRFQFPVLCGCLAVGWWQAGF